MDFNAFSTENNDFFCSLNAGSENSGDFSQNLVISNSAIEAMLFYECRSEVLINHSESCCNQDNLNAISIAIEAMNVRPRVINTFCHHFRILTSFSMTVSTTWTFCSSLCRSLYVR